MRMTGIIDLQELSANHWQAKYQGNYGIYTIQITTGGRRECSCPNPASPCKHIGMVEAAIAERAAAEPQPAGKGGVTRVLKDLTRDELYQFIVREAKHNPTLTNAIWLEFAKRTPENGGNKYVAILRDVLKRIRFNVNRLAEREELIELEPLNRWLKKAAAHIDEGNAAEAALICKAAIEELAAWLHAAGDDVIYYVDGYYQDQPLEILGKTVGRDGVSAKEIFTYCITEMKKPKYADAGFQNGFHRLLAQVAPEANPDGFIALQDALLTEIQDKTSDEAQQVLQRKIDFYRSIGQEAAAIAVLEANLQIDDFRQILAEKMFAEKQFAAAKALIYDLLNKRAAAAVPPRDDKHTMFCGEFDEANAPYYNREWQVLLLNIAREENDVPEMRRLAFLLIEHSFDEEYFRRYKATFSAEEWGKELEKLLRHYRRQARCPYDLVAELLAAENAAARLLEHLEKHPTLKMIEKYYRVFAPDFPERTLALFRRALDAYAEKNVGRAYYDYIAKLLRKMGKIPGGTAIVAEIVADYGVRYKSRRALMEVLGRI